MLSIPATIVAIPSANAAVTVPTTCFVYAVPDPVGVNQLILVTYRIDKLSPTAQGTSGGDHFGGFTVTITDPEGQVTTKQDLTTDSTSTGWFAYYPTKTGVYKFKANFPQTTIVNNAGVSYTFLASESVVDEVTVQANPIPTIQDNPLPTGYWTRPVYGENKNWYTISGNWLMQGYNYIARAFGAASSAYAPYTTAPDTAHILWAKPIIPGGIVGGEFGDQIYFQGLSYEQHYNPMIWNGRIIFTEHDLATTTVYQTRCVDLYTGEDIWVLANVSIAFTQVLMTSNPNEHGGVPYLVETTGSSANATWRFYDAWSGRRVFNLFNFTWGGAGSYNVPTRIGPNGEILSFYFNFTAKTLSMWNSTKAIYRPGFIDTWSPTYGSNIDGSIGIEWTVSIPDLWRSLTIWDVNLDEGFLLAYATDNSVTPYIYTNQAWDIGQMKKDSSGNYPSTLHTLFTKNRTDIWESYFIMTNIGSGVYGMYDQSKCQYHVYNIRTGDEIWVSEPDTDAWASFNWAYFIAYDILYTSGYDGHVTAFNATTGEVIWDYFFGSAGYENAYGTYPVYSGFNIADGKVYITNDEHSPDSIPWRGGKLWCLDAYDGNLLWSISGKLRNGAISSGYFTTLNSLDGQVYTFGKGPSATTVSAPQTAVPKGTAAMITGTITDQSPGAKGTPAISDADMTPWMEYLYEQKPMPTDATGVPVMITATYPDGHTEIIGTATSDIGGSYGLAWTPTVEGTYQIMATFEGTHSYGSSYATTYMVVGPAASAVTTSTPTPTQTIAPTSTPSATVSASPTVAPTPGTGMSTETLLIAGAAVVIIIAVIAAALVLRKRK